MSFFRELRPTVKLLLILLAAVIPFGVFVALRANNGDVPVEETPIPSDSPDTPLDFPFGSSTTTTLFDTSSTTSVTTFTATTRRSTPTTRRSTPTTRRVTTTTRPVTTPCTPRTYPLPTINCAN